VQSEVGRRREVGLRNGVVPGATVRDAIGTVAGADVGHQVLQSVRQSAPPLGLRWGTGRTSAGQCRRRPTQARGRGRVPGAQWREAIGRAVGAEVGYRAHKGGRQSAPP